MNLFQRIGTRTTVFKPSADAFHSYLWNKDISSNELEKLLEKPQVPKVSRNVVFNASCEQFRQNFNGAGGILKALGNSITP